MNTAYHILLVDDDTDLLQLLSMRLKAAGYTVRTAQNGKEALALIPVVRPHLVITDLRMDGMDGLTLFKFLQQSNPALPVIILTAHGTIPDAVEAAHQGVFRFLTKPFDSKILLEHIAQALKLSSNSNDREDKSEKEKWSQSKLVAESEANVFIHGDSGTGKELLAQAIHLASPRANKAFVPVNCSAIPETLFESELFGHVKGSFTGALKDHHGLFQSANLGTLFLDEIGDLPLTLQTKLLRVLQERKIRPVGSTTAVDIDVRIISATHVNLEDRLKKGLFREDLYYRLNVVNLEIPTLSQRREDISLLAKYFLNILIAKNRKNISGFAPDALELLVHANFPGNVRQLFNVVEQCVALSLTPIIPATLVQKALRDKPVEILPFNEARQRFERDYLIQILQITGGNVAQAARLAQRNRTDFYKLLERHNLTPASFKATDEEK